MGYFKIGYFSPLENGESFLNQFSKWTLIYLIFSEHLLVPNIVLDCMHLAMKKKVSVFLEFMFY